MDDRKTERTELVFRQLNDSNDTLTLYFEKRFFPRFLIPLTENIKRERRLHGF